MEEHNGTVKYLESLHHVRASMVHLVMHAPQRFRLLQQKLRHPHAVSYVATSRQSEEVAFSTQYDLTGIQPLHQAPLSYLGPLCNWTYNRSSK